MTEMIVDFNNIQETLEPFFAGKLIKITLEGDEARITPQVTTQKKVLKARGMLNHLAGTKDIAGEKGAWERAVVEKYAKLVKGELQNG